MPGIAPHAYAPLVGTVRCAVCNSPRLALIHATQQVRDNPCLSAEDITPTPVPPAPSALAAATLGPAAGEIEPEIIQALREARVEPFPQEPAFNSPAAVEQAAETMRRCRRAPALTPAEVAEMIAAHEREVLRLRKTISAVNHRADELFEQRDKLALRVGQLADSQETDRVNLLSLIRAQRDALADALEACDWSYGRVQSDAVQEQIAAALRKAGR